MQMCQESRPVVLGQLSMTTYMFGNQKMCFAGLKILANTGGLLKYCPFTEMKIQLSSEENKICDRHILKLLRRLELKITLGQDQNCFLL